jgi:hypothetical protein
MRSDCGDIRFTDSDGITLLNYWIEGPINSSNTRIWVKVPNIPANSIKKIYLYYGNPDATSLSNPDATFVFFEDFSSDPNTNGKWEIYRYSADTANEFVYDPANRRVYLTKAATNKGAIAFFKDVNTPDSFRLITYGGAGGGTGADGWAFGFFKDISPYRTYGRCDYGGSFGLMASDGTNRYISKGFAIEFDNYQNTGDPSANHNALVDTSVAAPYNHIRYVNTNIANEDNTTHRIEIKVSDQKTQLLIDDTVYIDYTYTYTKTYRAIGFGAGTGGATNNHWIEKCVILANWTYPEPTVKIGQERIVKSGILMDT